MTNYTIGREFEYYIKKKFEKAGFYVIRSAGSHTVADLVAVKENLPPIFIQCKRYELSPYEVKRTLTEMKDVLPKNVICVLAYKKNRRVILESPDGSINAIFGTIEENS